MVSIKKTRKRPTKLMTIPKLRSSFEQLDKIAMNFKGKDKDIQIKEFQAAWKSIFARDVSPKAIESYLAVKHAEPSTKRGTRRRSRGKQGGGSAPLGGAPLDYQTRPGIDGVHGQFPAYVSSGLSFYDSINQIGRFQQNGGDLLSAMLYKPVDSSVPPNLIQQVKDVYTGVSSPIGRDLQTQAWAAAK
jgi:hypothetical protein